MTVRHRTMAAATLTVLTTLTLGACSGDGGGTDEPQSTEQTTTAATDPTSDPDAPGDPDAPATVTVEASGDGPIALTSTAGGDGADGEAQSVSGRLVTGQGSCLALVETGGNDGPPTPLFLPSDAEAVTDRGRPSVTLPGQATVNIGETMDVEAVSVPLSDVDGVPGQCRGGSDTALVVR